MKYIYKIIILTYILAISSLQAGIFHKGKGIFQFRDPNLINGKFINVYYYMPANYTNNSPILFVCHGVNRNADDYLDQWNEHTEKYNALLIVPEFSEYLFPLDQDYNMGNMFKMNEKDSLLSPNPKSEWSFSLIEPIFDFVKKKTGNKSKGYSLYGHSAGSQFVQRFILFNPNSRCTKAISANAGWYTMIQPETVYPYGFKGTSLSNIDLSKVFKKKFIVLLGTADTNQKDKNLRVTPQAMLQGPYRFARGQKFFNEAKEFAEKNNFVFNWEMKFVKGVGHSNKRMSVKAAKLLFSK